jgi:hypothetical protein
LCMYYKRACITPMANQHTTKGQPKRTRTVLVRLTPDEYDRVLMVAANNRCQLSQFIRYCLALEPIGDTQRRSMINSLREATRRANQKGA